MNQVISYLQANPVVYLATLEGGEAGRPRVRPFQFMLAEKGKIYFCTGKGKDVFEQLQANPRLELCIMAPDFSWLRISGRAAFSEDRALKERVLNSSEQVKGIYKSPDNPEFAVFSLEDAKAGIYDFSGNPPSFFEL